MISSSVQSVSPDLFGPIAGRISDYALKIAVLLEAAWGAPGAGKNIHIGLPIMEVAIELAERCRQDSEKLAVEIGNTADEKKLQRLVEIVKAKPGITRSAVGRTLKLDKWHLDRLEETAVDRELIDVRDKSTKGRPSKGYWALYLSKPEEVVAGA